MNMVEAVRTAVLTWDPNEEENLDEGAIRQVAAYLEGTDYKVEDIIRSDKGPDERLSDDNIYFLYDAMKWTRAEQELAPGETAVLRLEDLG